MKSLLTKFLSGLAAFGIATSAYSLNIVPTFDSSIVNDPNGAAMMTAITAANQDVQSHYADTITVYIKYVGTNTGLGLSFTWGKTYSYSAYLAALKSRAASVDDNNALSKLPNSTTDPVIGGTLIHLTLPLARLMGLDSITGPDGFDSTISLNMSIMNLTRPPGVSTNFDLQQVTEHEIDEVLGCSSSLPGVNPISPIDLFRYANNLSRTYTTNGDNAYFSVDGTNLLARFNMNAKGDYSDWSSFDSKWAPPGTTPHPQVQDAFSTPGVVIDYGINELAMLDVIGWTVVADGNPPTVTMDSPTPSGAYNVVPIASGSARDTNGIGNSGVQEVQVVLSRTADGFWWNFWSNTWGNAVFNAFYNIQTASGTASWTATLPSSLADGGYQVQAQAVDYAGNASGWLTHHFVIDTSPPTVTINSPANISYKVAPPASGTAADNNGIADTGVTEVRVVLYRTSDAVWWNFHDNTWGTTNFNAFYNLSVATGTTSWSATLPASLADGGYQVQAQSVDAAANASGWVTRNFTIDNTAPIVTFSPLVNQQVVFNFDQLGGTVSKTSMVQFKIEWFRTGGNQFWNGVNWTSVANDPGVLLAANLSGLNWTPAPGTLPPRLQLAQADYVIHVYATDTAGNGGSSDLVLARSAPDTTGPGVTLDSISPGQVFTNTFLPGVFGTASDPESGIASVTVYLMRATHPGYVYWTGSSWDSNPASLTTTYNSGNGTWSLNVSLPSGGNLINAEYQIQVSAANKESPTGSQGISVDFSVDYHPVYLWTAGSFSDLDPNNNNNSWSNAANWDAGEVPPANAVAVINGVPNGGPDITSMGTVNIYGVNMSGGTLTTSGMLINKFYWSGGQISAGTISIPSNGVFAISGATDKVLAGTTINNSGTATWSGTGNLRVRYGSVLSNSGTFTVQNDAQVINYDSGGPPPVFINSGTFIKTNGTNTTFTSPLGGMAFNNNGTLSVQSGLVALGGGGTGSNGTFSAAAGSRIELTSGSFFLNGNTSFGGAGTNRVSGAATLTFGGGTSTLSGGNNFEVAAGSVAGTNSFAGAGAFNWSGGTISANLSLPAGVSFNLGGSAEKRLSGGVIGSAGPGTWSGSGNLVIYNNNSVISNSGTFTVLGDAQVTENNSYSGVFFINNGTFLKADGTNTTFNPNFGGMAFNNNGTLSVQSGVVALGGGGTGSNGTFSAAAGSGIDWTAGNGFLNGNTSFSGAGTNRVNGAALTFGGGTSTLSGGNNFEVAAGSVAGTNSFAGAGAFNWSGGT